MRNIISFSKNKATFKMPHLLEVQLESYSQFTSKTIKDIFTELFPVADIHNRYQLVYNAHRFGSAKYLVNEAIEKGATYSVPLKVSFRLVSKEDGGDIKNIAEQEIYLCDMPVMTPRGTFIINGVERVVVSQIHRSPGVYFSDEQGTRTAMIIPYRGQWVEFIVDHTNTFYAILDRKRKLIGSMFLRSLGYETNEKIIKLFYPTKEVDTRNSVNTISAEPIYDGDSLLFPAGELIEQPTAEVFKSKGIKKVKIIDSGHLGVGILANTFKKDRTSSQEEAAKKIYTLLRSMAPPTLDIAIAYIKNILFDANHFNLGDVGRFKLNMRLGLNERTHKMSLTEADLFETFRKLFQFTAGEFTADDIDHLGNRRVRRVGELLEGQFRLALTQLIQNIKERASLMDEESLSPQDLINPRLVSNIINKFFTTSQLSQFMEQTNSISEMTHKRRISSLGSGGLKRQTAGFEVRDVHFSHYSRICPIETPEGPNIGLISSLASHARIDKHGFILAPYWIVKNSRVTEEYVFLRADEEDKYTIAQANTPIDKNGKILSEQVLCRRRDDFPLVPPHEVDLMDVSPEQVFSPSAALIPFLEHNDADRALMGSNMMRQAVPVIEPEIPLVGTGLEERVAKNSGTLLIAEEDGLVTEVDSRKITIETNKGIKKRYHLSKFLRSNQNTCIHQKPLISIDKKVKKGDILADGYATKEGYLALGRNSLVAFMPFLGFNFEDAIIVSEELLKNDAFTSLHILEFDCEVRETKLGPEEVTRDIPGISDFLLKDLDEYGVVRTGAHVGPDDILVGKITPKGETELTPEERLMRAVFAEKATNVRDTSLRVEPGVEGVIIDRKVLTRRTTDALAKKMEEAQRTRLKEEFTILHNESTLIRNNFLKQELLNKTAASTIRDDKGRVLLRKGSELNEEFFANLNTTKITADEKFVTNDKINNEVINIVLSGEEKLTQIIADRKLEEDKLLRGDELPHGVLKIVKVFIAQKRKVAVGDKMSGRHGNKGVVAKIMPEESMPFLPDGTPVDIILNPLGVPSRMNVGQILETHLGWAADQLKFLAITPIFDGATVEEIKQKMAEANLPLNGQIELRDGRTGKKFNSKITVGRMYMLKLIHMVDEKMHARSTGPYSLITQQPLGGKAQFGGQRLGEMEVWALEAYGAAFTLQEMLTVKSDDVEGRAAMYESLIRGKNPPRPRAPASFNVLLKELQGLGFNITLEKKEVTDET
ncbi:DNA-directed RNA polymerase subunit beta [candidate division WOR-3 bacterium RBG_13_43_14]|uniref:DNA-directed RNA polymerase subunit beta n=1 Tax=candidate division WOR-3 bacterium RBG_13_43_14 TaxID=1802590 RepID=A0A1F4UI65_UNCW3|nr:MAG: DNA-directed RNA polymerase subunit beta [candidate division WOR-3 bacterium RBG_13_43_14]